MLDQGDYLLANILESLVAHVLGHHDCHIDWATFNGLAMQQLVVAAAPTLLQPDACRIIDECRIVCVSQTDGLQLGLAIG